MMQSSLFTRVALMHFERRTDLWIHTPVQKRRSGRNVLILCPDTHILVPVGQSRLWRVIDLPGSQRMMSLLPRSCLTIWIRVAT